MMTWSSIYRSNFKPVNSGGEETVMFMFWKWFRVSLEFMIAAFLIAASGATWLLMILPDPVSFLIGFGGMILFVFASEDLDKCERIARKRSEAKKHLLEKRK